MNEFTTSQAGSDINTNAKCTLKLHAKVVLIISICIDFSNGAISFKDYEFDIYQAISPFGTGADRMTCMIYIYVQRTTYRIQATDNAGKEAMFWASNIL